MTECSSKGLKPVSASETLMGIQIIEGSCWNAHSDSVGLRPKKKKNGGGHLFVFFVCFLASDTAGSSVQITFSRICLLDFQVLPSSLLAS